MKITESEARYYLNAAKALQNSTEDRLESYFWWGYSRGIRRAWHGEGFGDEHHRYMMSINEAELLRAPADRLRVLGYKAGLAGKAPSVAAEEAGL